MSRKELNGLKRKIIPILKKNKIVRAGIFGSYARGEQKKNSDVDILVEFNKSLLALVKFERELKGVLGKNIDVITYKSINPLIKDQILRDEVRIL